MQNEIHRVPYVRVYVRIVANSNLQKPNLRYSYRNDFSTTLNYLEREGVECDQRTVHATIIVCTLPSNKFIRKVQAVLKFVRISVQNNHEDWDIKLVNIEYFINRTPNTESHIENG